MTLLDLGLALRHGLALLVKHWRLVLLTLLTLGVVQYVRTAEQAKQTLRDSQLRATIAESLVVVHEQQATALTVKIDTLKGSVQRADQRYAAALERLRRTRPTPTFVPDSSADTIPQPPLADTTPVLERPEVQELLALCDARVEARDSVIVLQDARHVADTLTIRQLRAIVPTPIAPPKPPSRLSRIALGVASGTAGALIGQQVSGQKGLLIGASIGTLLSLIR